MKYISLLLGIVAVILVAVGITFVGHPKTTPPIQESPLVNNLRPLPPSQISTSTPAKNAGTQSQKHPPPHGIACNGSYWLPCDPGQTFSCPQNGGEPECLEFEAPSSLAPRPITAKSIVGLLCHYNSKDPVKTRPYSDNEGNILSKASGILVSPDGYILTAKHLIDPAWSSQVYASTTPEWEQILESNIEFDYCEVGVPPSDALPTTQEIKTLNPQLALIHPFPYIATLFFKPSQENVSELEYRQLDFAVLKISRPRSDCENQGSCTLPTSFPYNPMLISEIPPVGTEVISFGYPAEAINASGGAFTDFLRKGAVGNIQEHYGGDQYFKGKNFVFRWSANNIISGRSGSPIFWKGYMIGLFHAGNSQNSTVDYALTTRAVYQVLQNSHLEKIVTVK